jgi:hypothetical protein
VFELMIPRARPVPQQLDPMLADLTDRSI